MFMYVDCDFDFDFDVDVVVGCLLANIIIVYGTLLVVACLFLCKKRLRKKFVVFVFVLCDSF